jgi:hypothetical protein
MTSKISGGQTEEIIKITIRRRRRKKEIKMITMKL